MLRLSDGTAGGCPTEPTFFQNTQYLLELECMQQEIVITLSQCALSTAPGAEPHPIGFVLLSAPEGSPVSRRRTLGTPGGAFGYTAIRAICPSDFAAKSQVGVRRFTAACHLSFPSYLSLKAHRMAAHRG